MQTTFTVTNNQTKHTMFGVFNIQSTSDYVDFTKQIAWYRALKFQGQKKYTVVVTSI
jgi:hypothetical protein